MSSRHVFLSYCRDNAAEVARLYEDLTRAGLTVWWDQQIGPGQDWKLAIRTAMKNSSAVLLSLSAEAQQRATTGIYPEACDAIEALPPSVVAAEIESLMLHQPIAGCRNP